MAQLWQTAKGQGDTACIKAERLGCLLESQGMWARARLGAQKGLCCLPRSRWQNEHICGNALNTAEKFYTNARRNGRFSTGDFEIDVVTSAALMFSPKNFILCFLLLSQRPRCSHNRGSQCVCIVILRLRERKSWPSNLLIPNFPSFLLLFVGFPILSHWLKSHMSFILLGVSSFFFKKGFFLLCGNDHFTDIYLSLNSSSCVH